MAVCALDSWPAAAPEQRQPGTSSGPNLLVAEPLGQAASGPSSCDFEALCARFRPQLEATAMGLAGNPHDAGDLVQDTVVRAFRSFGTFVTGTNFQGWIMRILRNLHINEYRKRRCREAVVSWEDIAERSEAQPLDAVHDARGEPEHAVLREIPSEEVVSALASLSDDFRHVLELADVHGLSYPEIAQHLSVPTGTVRSRLSRARQQMRRKLAHYAVRHGYLRQDELAAAHPSARVGRRSRQARTGPLT